MLQTKGRLLYTDENALDRKNEDGSVAERNWGSIGANFLVNIPKNKNNHAQKSTKKVRDTSADHFFWTRGYSMAMEYIIVNRIEIILNKLATSR